MDMNRRHFAAASLLLALGLAAHSQEATSPLAWTTGVEPVKSVSGERLYRLQFTGRITPGYIVYGSDFKANLGPNPTRLRFKADGGITPQGALQSTATHKGTDKAFKTDYTYFEGEAKLSQVVAVAAGTGKITGTLVGQTCHEASGTCALFQERFEIPLAE
jgi:thiol:disulfide interchange protein DsbD